MGVKMQIIIVPIVKHSLEHMKVDDAMRCGAMNATYSHSLQIICLINFKSFFLFKLLDNEFFEDIIE